MKKKKFVLTAVLTSAVTLCAVYLSGAAPEIARSVLLENIRVQVTERVIPPGAERLPYIRGTDQVIVFLSDTTYERVDPVTGEKEVRKRKAGDVIWHSRAERAPRLINIGETPMRSLVIALK